MPDDHRRVHPRVPGHRRSRLDPLQALDRGAHAPRQPARRSALPALGQRPRVVSLAVLEWLAQAGIGTALIDPGKPWQNANDESFNGKLRDECLGVEWFRSRAKAKVVIETWRRYFNTIRPHSSLNYLTPLEFKQQHHSIPNRAILRK
jgi:transposase InsO family protein